MFSRSYAPSFVLEQAANNPTSDSVQLASARSPPQAFAPPTPVAIEDVFGDAQPVEIVMVEELPAPQPEHPFAATSTSTSEPEKRKVRTSTIGRALFPPSANLSFNKRLSLPSGPAKKTSVILKPQRKSLSPVSASSRASTLHAASSGSLLALPLAAQLHSLKARNASLEKSLASVNATQSNGLFKATTRIASLEKELADKEKLQLEAEGWEAEATRLAAELEGQQALVESAEERAQSAELALEVEKGKKKRYKDLGAKLRCELLNRKWKEKWELCMMDMADRDRDANEVRLEAEIAMLRLQAGLARLDKEELEELTSRQATSLSELTASRELLLASYKGAETIIATLRSELATAHKDSSKDASALKKELTAAKSALKSAQAEVERLGGVEREVEGLRGEVEELRRGEKVGEGKEKEVGEARKALEKEKGKREKAEADAKDLKASLKQSQVELRDANKAAAAAAKTVESKVAELAKVKASLVVANSKASKTKPAPLPSVAALASRKRRSLTHDGSDPVPALDEDEEPAVAEEAEEADSPMEEEVVDDEEGDTSLEDLKAVAKSRAATKKVKASAPAPPPSPPISVPDDEEQEEEESYRPPAPKAKSRAAPKPKAKAVLADAEVAVEEDEPKAGKRKAGVLADKTANATKKTKVVKAEAGVGGKKKKAAAVAEEEQDEPAKKKKRTLFGGPKKFTGWGSIENADVNSLGLPINLSPVKPNGGAARPTSLGMGRGLGGRTSIFN